MNRLLPHVAGILLVFGLLLGQTSGAHAACAKVSIEILQELTLERTAFDAKMVITNGIADQYLEDMRVDVVVRDASGTVKNESFFVRPPSLSGISGALDGSGRVAPSANGEAHWLIIPSPGAGFIEENGVLKQIGVDYWVGATLSYKVNGLAETVPINPAKITVKPMPQLALDYFMPHQVIGDNPFTPQVEPPVAYPLAVRVMNDGYGTAANLRIDSAQPKIVDNKQGLLINFKILGATVNDSAVTPSLNVNFGDLPSKKGATASWQMISTLSGHFESFSASFTHASELGGDLTSFIKQDAVKTHYLTHMVKVNLPGRDGRLDFLAEAIPGTTTAALPDTIFETEITYNAGIASDRMTVTRLEPNSQPVRPTPQEPGVALSLPTVATGWIYTKMADPSQGLLKLLDVIRADGVHLDPHNFWVDQGLDADYKKTWTLQLIDYRADNGSTPGTYTLKFTQPDLDAIAPTTTLIFDGPVVGTNPAYITPETRLILTATDNDGGSGVDGMYRKVAEMDSTFTNQVAPVDATFISALPFNLANESNGAKYYKVRYYSTDLAGKVEDEKSANVTVVATAPVISQFTATPTIFSPQAPKGIHADRTVGFRVTATSGVTTLSVEIAISPGASFQADKVVRILKGTATSGSALLSWDGKDSSGKLLPIGSYTAQVKVSDGLDNPANATATVHTTTATTTVTIAGWFNATPVDPYRTAEGQAFDQLHPKASGTKVVWQDQRGGNWDIYLKDLAGGNVQKISNGTADHQYPAVDGDVIVWQEGSDIYRARKNAESGIWESFAITTGSGIKARPAISGNWVVWQGKNDDAGKWNVFARDISLVDSQPIQLTSHPDRDQVNPAISGTTVVWEDYRNGPADIYQYDLNDNLVSGARDEAKVKRITFNADQQLQPIVTNGRTSWTDRRNGRSDIYLYDPAKGELRITYGDGDHSQPALLGDLLVYTDYESGAEDPNLSFRVLASGIGGRLSDDPARQEEPALGTGKVLWQDNRSGKFQIYAAPFATEQVDIEAAIKPGFNLVAVGSSLATQYHSARDLITAKAGELGTMRLLSHDPLHNTYTEVTSETSETNFNLVQGAGLVIYAQRAGNLQLAASEETATYTLLPGVNQIGILTVPFGYNAYGLMNSLGLDNVQSVRRFDNLTGVWQTAAVRQGAHGNETAGMNFVINPGDGLQITMKNRVDGWAP